MFDLVSLLSFLLYNVVQCLLVHVCVCMRACLHVGYCVYLVFLCSLSLQSSNGAVAGANGDGVNEIIMEGTAANLTASLTSK